MKITLLSLLLVLNSLCAAKDDDEQLSTIKINGLERTYVLHQPPDQRSDELLPIVFVFHGGSGNAVQMERFSQFDKLADRERFLVVYPNGIDKSFNDGRVVKKSRAHSENIDDMGFVSALLDLMIKDHGGDPQRVYATGISNGAIMSHRLAAEMSDRFVAIAGVCGSLAEPLSDGFAPAHAVSVLVMNGTDDPMLPYNGGEIALKRGFVISTDDILKKWIAADGCRKKGLSEPPLNEVRKDGTRILTTRWKGGRDNTEVVLMKVEGGGHTWPSGPQYLPEFLIGKTSKEIDATAVIWEFFSKHTKADRK